MRRSPQLPARSTMNNQRCKPSYARCSRTIKRFRRKRLKRRPREPDSQANSCARREKSSAHMCSKSQEKRTAPGFGNSQIPTKGATLLMGKEQFPSLAGQGAIAVDLETNDPELRKRGPGAHRGGYIAGIAVGTEAGFRGYYPIAHENDESNLPREKVLAWLRQQLALPVPKIGAHLLYDLIFLDAANVKSCGPYWDIQIAEPLIDENRRVYSLDSLARKYLKTGKREEKLIWWIEELLGIKRHHKEHIWRVPAKIAAKYAIGDVDLPLRIFKQQEAELKKLDLWRLFLMESKLIPMLVAMHVRGVRVDLDKAEQLYRSMSERQNTLMAQIKRETG